MYLNKTITKIIKMFIENNELEINDISSKLNISDRMVFNYINHINSFFKNKENEIKIRKQTFVLNKKQIELLKDFLLKKEYILSPEERESVLMFSLILYSEKPKNIFNVSDATFSNDLKNVEKKFKASNLKLSNYKLMGSNNDIRNV